MKLIYYLHRHPDNSQHQVTTFWSAGNFDIHFLRLCLRSEDKQITTRRLYTFNNIKFNGSHNYLFDE